jgi:acetyl esterase
MIQPEIRKALAAMPAVVDPKYSTETRALYAPLHATVIEGVDVAADVAYGQHPRQKLDIYAMPGSKADTIVVYVPGGGFTGGDKKPFANVGSFFAKRGMIGVAMNYRLAPEVAWPAGAEDVASAVAWLKANAAQFGATAKRVVVFGHSAGASHCATFLFDPVIKGADKVAGAILAAGPAYTLSERVVTSGINMQSYFGNDQATYERRSATAHVAGTKVPVMLAFAENDPSFLVVPTLEMAIALSLRDGKSPPLVRLGGHNHFSPPCSLGTSDDELSGAIIEFMHGLG